jgi:hypothetical protein
MSVDRCYTQNDGKWHKLAEAELACCSTDFWVDICHGGNMMIDERYHCFSLADALEFYSDGWKQREYLDDNGLGCGFDHMGLYSRGRLIHGQSSHGDFPGHEGEGLRQMVDPAEISLEEEEL